MTHSEVVVLVVFPLLAIMTLAFGASSRTRNTDPRFTFFLGAATLQLIVGAGVFVTLVAAG